MLAPIAWRTPPRHYGPWELFASLLDRGAGRPRPRRHAVRHRRLAHRRSPASATAPHGWCGGRRASTPKVAECLHIADVVRARGRIRHHPQRLRLPAAHLQRLVDTPVVTTIHGFSSQRILPVYERYDDTHHLCGHQRRRPPSRPHYAATIHHGIDTDAFRARRRTRRAPRSSSGGSIPTRAPPRRSRWPRGPAAAWSSPASSRTRLLRRRGRQPHVDGDRVRYLGPVAADRRARRARRRGRAAAPHRLRRAVRLQRGRGDGLRHAGHRPPPGLDAGAHRRRRHRLPRRRPSTRPSPPCARSRGWTARLCVLRSRHVSMSGGWSTTT